MNILVTGATGFVGSHIVRMLLADGHRVRVLRRESSSTKMLASLTSASESRAAGSGLAGLSVESAIGDVTDRNSVFAAVEGCKIVFHAAGVVSFWRGLRKIQRGVNVDGTRHVVEACLAHKVERLIHTSSIAAIGFASGGQVGDEALEYNWSPYRIHYNDTKHLAELEVHQGIKRGLDAVIVNPAVVFGPGDLNLNAGAMVFQMARSKIPFYFLGGCTVCDVEDVARGHILAFEKGKCSERYILGGDHYTWKDLLTLIAQVVGVPPPQRQIPTWALSVVAQGYDLFSRLKKKEPPATPESIRVSSIPAYYSSDKAIRELGYKISPFRETVKKTYEWYAANGYLRRSL